MGYFNFENGVTPINDTNLNAMQDEIKEDITNKTEKIKEKNNMIAVGFNSDYSMTSSNWVQKDLTFDKLVSQVGNKLSLVSGKVKIGAGITKVKASFQTSTANLGNDTFYDVALKHNTTTVAGNAGKKTGDPQAWSFPIAPVLINVVEGDTISVSCFANSVTFNSAITQFVVEAIDYEE